jgi:AcrR family transcriptional regulator
VASPAAGLREQRRTRRVEMSREHILDVAEALFGDTGYQATSLEQVAGGSEFSVGALYTFFASKRDLLDAVLTRRFAQMRGRVEDILAQRLPGLDELLALCAYYLEFFQAHPSFGRLTLRVYPAGLESVPDFARYQENAKEATELLARALRAGQAEGTIRDADASWLGTLVRGMLMFHHSLTGNDTPPSAGADELLALIRSAVAAPPRVGGSKPRSASARPREGRATR